MHSRLDVSGRRSRLDSTPFSFVYIEQRGGRHEVYDEKVTDPAARTEQLLLIGGFSSHNLSDGIFVLFNEIQTLAFEGEKAKCLKINNSYRYIVDSTYYLC